MKKFIFVMQHNPTAEQIAKATEIGQVVELADKKLLLVPDDASLSKAWFIARAFDIVSAVGGISEGDTLHCMGQQQLSMAVSAFGRHAGATLVESVTPRISKETPQADGSVKKENVFTFAGFRTVHQY